MQSPVAAAGGWGEPAEELLAIGGESGRGEGVGDDLFAAKGCVNEDGAKYQNGSCKNGRIRYLLVSDSY